MKLNGGRRRGGCAPWSLPSSIHLVTMWLCTTLLLVVVVDSSTGSMDLEEWMSQPIGGDNSSDVTYEECPDDWFLCLDQSNCLLPDRIQDGINDCNDESDEACTDTQHECLCGLPRCVDASLVGDGVPDCIEGSDEMHIEKSAYICPSDLEELNRQRMDSETTSRGREKRAAQQAIKPQLDVQTTLFSGADDDVTTKRPVGVIASSVVTFVNDRTTSEYVTILKGSSIDGSYAHITTKSSRVFFAEPIRLTTATVFNAAKFATVDAAESIKGSIQTDPVLGREILVTATRDSYTKQGPDNTFVTHTVLKGSIPVNDETSFQFLLGDSASPDQSGIMLVKEGDGTRVVYSSEANFEVVQPPRSDGSTPVIRLGTAELGGEKLSGVLVESPKNEMHFKTDVDLSTGDIELLTITIGTPVDVAQSTKFPEKMMIMKMEDLMKSTGHENEITENSIPQARKVSMNNSEKEIIVPDRVGARNLNLPTFTVKVPDQTLEEVVHGAGGLRKKPHNAIPDFKITKKSKNVEDIRAEFNLESGDRRSDLPTVTYIGFADFTTTIADTVVVFTPRSKTVTQTSQQVLVTRTREPEPVRVASPFDGFGPISSLAPRKVPDGPTYQQTPPLESSLTKPDSDEMKTVMVKKSDGSSMMQDEKEVLTPVTQTSLAQGIIFSTIESKRYNTVDLYPSGLVSSIGGTIIGNGMTTVFTTYIYGTFIKNQYAQIVQSTSSIFYLVSRAPGSSISPSRPSTIVATEPPTSVEEVTKKDFLQFEHNYDLDEVTTESITNNVLEDFFDNSIGRAISSDPSEQTIVEREKDGSLPAEVTPSVTTLTHYTTYFRKGDLTVSTQYETSTVVPFFEISLQESSEHNDESDFTTLTSYTTKFVSGSTQVVSNTEVVSVDMIKPTGVLKMETTKSPPEDMMNLEMFGSDDFTTPRTSTESVTESFSESISETSTDLSSQDVTEQPLFNLDSSLNPEEDVDAIFYPRTYYITYTYFTTFHQENSSSVISSFETVTNIITNSLELDEHRTISPVTATPPVTYWTTYTYWTTFHKDNTTVTTSSEETVSNVVGATAGISPTKTNEVLIITPTSTFKKLFDDEVMETVDVTTYYTTYTYYTSTFLGSSTIVNSRLETITNVVPSTQTEVVNSEIPSILFGFDDTTEETTTTEFSPFVEEVVTEDISTVDATPNDQPIGLLSTIRGSTILDGTTTLFSTRVFGTIVDGLYFQMQSTTSQIITPLPSQTVGVLTVDAGKITENGLTTHFTSQYVGVVADGITTQEVRTTATIDGEPDFAAFLHKDSKTGIVRETRGSIIHGTETTIYQSTVLGTYIDGLYAQIIQSTSSSVIGPSAVFSTLPATSTHEVKVTPTLQASINDVTISPTPVLTPSLRLPIEKEFSSVDKKEKFRASSALSKTFSLKKSSIGSSSTSARPGGRPSSSRRPDIFGFIRRTSTFTFPSTLIGNLPGSDNTKISPTSTSQSKETSTEAIVKQEVENTELLEQPTRRHRFQASQRDSRPSIHPRESIRRKPSISPSSVKPVEKTKEVEEIPAEEDNTEGNSPVNSFRPFSFRRQEAAPGTRSSLPFLPRNRRPGEESEEPKGNRPVNSRFAPPTKATTAKSTTAKPDPTTEASKNIDEEKDNRPQSASRLSAEERRKQRQRLASRPALSRLFPKKNQDNLEGDGSELDVLYADVDGTLVNPDVPVELLFFTPEEASDVDLAHSRRKRQTDFAARVTSRGVSRGRARQPVAPADNEKSESSPSPRTARQPQSEPAAPAPRPRSRNTSPIRIPNRDLNNANKNPAVDIPDVVPTPKAADSKPTQFTLTNSRSRSRAVAAVRKPEPPAPPARTSEPRRPLNRPRLPSSRNTVPLGNIVGRGFRRPATDTNVRTTSRFSRPDKEVARPPAVPTRNRNARPNKNANNNINTNRRQESSNNPIQDFRNRPTPEIEPEPFLLPSSDGTFDIFEPITVTRQVPVTTSIPFVDNGRTIQKEVITASTQTEVIQPEQIEQTEINGEIKLLLSTIQNGNAITRIFIEPMETQIQVTANAFTNGKRTQITQVVPSQVFNVVTMTAAAGGDVQNLLQLLLGQQQQQQNPLLAALGLGQPSTSLVVRTSTYVTTVTSVLSTLLPIIFRGKMVTTTVVDSRTEVITATELITETVFAQNTLNPFNSPNPLNQLLPLLLQNQFQQQQPQNRPTRDEPVINDQPRTVAPSPPTVDPEPVVQTSVVTMFVSGRRPGEFSTILSTVTLDGGASRFKRQPTQVVQHTAMPHYIHTDKGLYKLPQDYEYDDMDWYVMSAINEVDSPNVHDYTPSLESVVPGLSYRLGQIPVTFNETLIADQDPFLWLGPAEHDTAKRRKVRSAQRGSRRFQGRLVGARKISSDTGTQEIVLDDDSVARIHTHPSVGEFKIPGLKIQNQRISEQIKQINAPTTFYTTFTYYTTLVDESGREFVQSSLDTITQVATQGVSGINELTRLVTTALPKDPGATEVFTLNDAIIPGKPRPVPEPSFEEPDPPFGPVVRNRGSRRPFQPIPEPPPPLSVEPVSERTLAGRPLFVLKRPQESTGSSLESTPTKPERRKVIKTLKRVIPKEEQTSSAAIESLPELEQTTTSTSRQRQRLVPSQVSPFQREIEEVPTEPLVLTQKQPQVKAPTAVAVPVDPYIGTIHTLYTVYSYLYEINSGDGSVVSSTRDVTVSNRVRPTVVTVPEQFRTDGQELNTIEVGDVTATLGQRIRESLTTEIYLASATLVDLNTGFERSPYVGERNTERTSLRRPSLSLQSSLLENEEIQSTSETPAISTTARFKPTNRFGSHRQITELAETSEVQPEQEDGATVEVTTEQEEPTLGRTGGRSTSRGSVRFRNSPNKVRFTVTRQRPQPAQIRTATPNRSRGEPISSTTTRTPTPLRSFMSGRQRSRGSSFDKEITTTPKPLPKLVRGRSRDRESTATEDTIYDDQEIPATDVPPTEIAISEKTFSESTIPERRSTLSHARTTPAPTTRPPRPAVRRDDIPIIRRPGSERSRSPEGSVETGTSAAREINRPDATERTRRPTTSTENPSLSKTSGAFDFSSFFSQIPSDKEVIEDSTSSPDQIFRFTPEAESQPSTSSPRTTTTTTTTSAPVKEFRFGKRQRSEEVTGPVSRDPLLFKSESGATPARESRFKFSEQRETTTEGLLFGFTTEGSTTEGSSNSEFRFKFTPSSGQTTPKTDLDLSNLESDLLPAEYLDDYYDYYYDEDHAEGGETTQSSVTDQEGFGKTGLGIEKPSNVLPPNVVYRTFTTNTFLPILGGEKTLTLSIVTSTLETLDATDAHLITKAPALFNPELLPKPLRSSVTTSPASKATLPFGFFPTTTSEVEKTTKTAAFGEFRFGSTREDKTPESRRSRFDTSRRISSRPSTRVSPTSSLSFGFSTQQSAESERRAKFEASQQFQTLDPSSVKHQPLTTSTSSVAFSFPTFTTNFQEEEFDEKDATSERVVNPFEAGLFAINKGKDSVEEEVPLNPFEAGLQAIQTLSQTDRPTEKGSTVFETKLRNQEEVAEVTINPLEAAISALKSAIYESEITATDQDEAGPNIEEDANLSIQDISSQTQIEEKRQIQPSDGQENAIFFSNDETSSERSPPIHNDNLLNAFEGIFESITESTTESTTSTPEDFSISPNIIEKEVPITEISTVTEEHVVVNTENSLIYNYPEINETDNMISEPEDYNILESVTNSVMKDSINAILESEERKDAMEIESSSLMPGDETTTSSPERFSSETDSQGESRDPKTIDFDGNDQVGTNLELTGPKKNLATKVMSNGVRVIVAGDQTLGSGGSGSNLPSEQTIRNSLQSLGAAVTLPPSTLSGQVLLRPSAEQGDIEKISERTEIWKSSNLLETRVDPTIIYFSGGNYDEKNTYVTLYSGLPKIIDEHTIELFSPTFISRYIGPSSRNLKHSLKQEDVPVTSTQGGSGNLVKVSSQTSTSKPVDGSQITTVVAFTPIYEVDNDESVYHTSKLTAHDTKSDIIYTTLYPDRNFARVGTRLFLYGRRGLTESETRSEDQDHRTNDHVASVSIWTEDSSPSDFSSTKYEAELASNLSETNAILMVQTAVSKWLSEQQKKVNTVLPLQSLITSVIPMEGIRSPAVYSFPSSETEVKYDPKVEIIPTVISTAGLWVVFKTELPYKNTNGKTNVGQESRHEFDIWPASAHSTDHVDAFKTKLSILDIHAYKIYVTPVATISMYSSTTRTPNQTENQPPFQPSYTPTPSLSSPDVSLLSTLLNFDESNIHPHDGANSPTRLLTYDLLTTPAIKAMISSDRDQLALGVSIHAVPSFENKSKTTKIIDKQEHIMENSSQLDTEPLASMSSSSAIITRAPVEMEPLIHLSTITHNGMSSHTVVQGTVDVETTTSQFAKPSEVIKILPRSETFSVPLSELANNAFKIESRVELYPDVVGGFTTTKISSVTTGNILPSTKISEKISGFHSWNYQTTENKMDDELLKNNSLKYETVYINNVMTKIPITLSLEDAVESDKKIFKDMSKINQFNDSLLETQNQFFQNPKPDSTVQLTTKAGELDTFGKPVLNVENFNTLGVSENKTVGKDSIGLRKELNKYPMFPIKEKTHKDIFPNADDSNVIKIVEGYASKKNSHDVHFDKMIANSSVDIQAKIPPFRLTTIEVLPQNATFSPIRISKFNRSSLILGDSFLKRRGLVPVSDYVVNTIQHIVDKKNDNNKLTEMDHQELPKKTERTTSLTESGFATLESSSLDSKLESIGSNLAQNSFIDTITSLHTKKGIGNYPGEVLLQKDVQNVTTNTSKKDIPEDSVTKVINSGQNNSQSNAFSDQVTQAPGSEDGSLQTNTYFTTLTYFSTIMAANRPFVITSRETLSNFVTTSLPHTGNYVERTQVLVNTETYYTTQTFTRTLEGESTPITSQEVITRVIITEAPSVTRTSVMKPSSISPMVVTKTYLTTFTYYKTEVSDQVTQVKTDTVVSSEIVTETMFITPEPTTPVAEMIKTPAPSLDSLSDELVYATRTFYTTSTHLTTLLEGGSTVTTSSVDVQSRIVTETIPATNLLGLKGSELLMPTAILEDLPRTEGYVHIGDDLYKRMKTFYATYTHYTTLADGSVNSREVTKTKIETSTVSTTHVPQTLIIQPTEVVADDDYDTDYDYHYDEGADYALIRPTAVSNTLLSSSSSGSRKPSLSASPSSSSSHVSGSAGKPGRTSTKGGLQGSSSSSVRSRPSLISPSSTSRINPSQLPSLKASIVTSQKTPGASLVQLDPSELFSGASDTTTEGLQATVTVEGGDTTDTTVVSDSTSSATILVGSSAQQNDFSSHSLVSTSVLTVPTVLRGADGASSTIDIGGTIAVVERNGERTVLAAVPEGLRPSRPTLADIEVTSGSALSSEATSQGSSQESSGVGTGAAIGLMVPVLSAVAGIIRNNMAGAAAAVAAVAKSDRGDEKIDMPRNTLIRMEEPHFIPVGGVAASMSNARREFNNPTQGFIPLNRFEGRATAQPSLAPLPRPILEFGGSSRGGGFQQFNRPGSFRPPSTTERGFTAIFTTGVVPTHVSVISGVETILFGEGIPKVLPPPGLPAPPGGEFKLIQPSFEEFAESRPVPEPALMESELATTELPSKINSRIDDLPSFRLPTALPPRTIVSVNGENRIVKTQVVEAVPFDKSSHFTMAPEILLHSTVGVGSMPVADRVNEDDHFVVDNKRTTVVNGVSTVMSGATTIFGSLFTRPAGTEDDEEDGDTTSIISGDDGETTKFISKVEKVAMTLTSTITEVKTVEGIPSTITEIVERTLPPRTIVSTVIGSETQVNTQTSVVPSPMIVVPFTTEMEEEDAVSTTEISFLDIDDVPSFAEHADAELNQAPNGASLGLAEENEISRVIQSQGPDQQVAIRDPIAVSDCKPRCSSVKNEVCKHTSSGKAICECRPGYNRNSEMDPCTPSRSFKVRVLLDSIKDDQLIFDPILNNMSHPLTQDLSEVTVHGLNRAFMDSALAGDFNRVSVMKFDGIKYTALPISAKDVDGGVIAELKVELKQPTVANSAGLVVSRQSLPDENFIKDALAQALRQSNYSLGGTEIFASPYAAVLESEDFDECSHPEHNDCSENAICFNAPGTFSCSCRDGFMDEGELAGRECRERTAKCKFCNYHGECTTNQDGQRSCQCQPWFSGDTCQVNLRVLLVVVVSVGGVLVMLMFLCGFFCCLKTRRSRRAATQLLPSSTMGGASTLDRRAIVHDTSSEESSQDTAPSYLAGHIRGPNKGKSDLEPAPQMLIPRVKGPAPKQPLQIQLGHDTNSDLSTPQAALVDILEGRSRNSLRMTPNPPRNSSVSGLAQTGSRSQTSSRAGSRERFDSHGGADDRFGSREQLDGTVSAIGGRRGSRDRYDESGGRRSTDRFVQAQIIGGPRAPPPPPQPHDQNSKRFHQLEDEISVHRRDTAHSKSSTYRFGGPERTISALRSCDETTVRPSLRSVPQHRPLSSQLLSEGGQTMAERDGCSTLVYPQQELYRPSQDLDSFSDMSEQQSRASHLFR